MGAETRGGNQGENGGVKLQSYLASGVMSMELYCFTSCLDMMLDSMLGLIIGVVVLAWFLM